MPLDVGPHPCPVAAVLRKTPAPAVITGGVEEQPSTALTVTPAQPGEVRPPQQVGDFKGQYVHGVVQCRDVDARYLATMALPLLEAATRDDAVRYE